MVDKRGLPPLPPEELSRGDTPVTIRGVTYQLWQVAHLYGVEVVSPGGGAGARASDVLRAEGEEVEEKKEAVGKLRCPDSALPPYSPRALSEFPTLSESQACSEFQALSEFQTRSEFPALNVCPRPASNPSDPVRTFVSFPS